MKKVLYIALILTVTACKKKTQEPEVLPDVVMNPSYSSEFSTRLTYHIKNGHVDTLLNASSRMIKLLNGVQSLEAFTSVSYNGSLLSDFDNLPSFMDQATHSSWTVTSDRIGNFNYTDNSPVPNCANCGTLTPVISKSTGFNINLTGLTNTDYVNIELLDPYGVSIYGNILYSYELHGSATLVVIPDAVFYSFISYFSSSSYITLNIELANSQKTQTINNNTCFFSKSTTYSYSLKVVN